MPICQIIRCALQRSSLARRWKLSASLHQYPAQSNPAGYPLVQKAILHLDDTAGSMAFSESEQSKNKADGMVPLYAARVQDLGTGDVVVFKCGAWGAHG